MRGKLVDLKKLMNYGSGCVLPVEDWAWLNRVGIFDKPELRHFVSPFPPPELMQIVSGLSDERDFASQSADLFMAVSKASPKLLTEYRSLLDFGCGCGRLARMFKGHPHRIHGCDIDNRHVDWLRKNLPYVESRLSSVNPPLPYCDEVFDGVISVSVFSHLTERDQDKFLAELFRVSQPGAILLLSIHGSRAVERALHDRAIRDVLCMDDARFEQARRAFGAGKHGFVLQEGHLTTKQSGLPASPKAISEPYEYGISFIPEIYIRNHWTRWFEVLNFIPGGIHDFQDIVVLTPRAKGPHPSV